MTYSIPEKPFEIFCGTGGVGKTTLATSRAIYLAGKGKKVLLITVDPAKRLKDFLHFEDNQDAGPISIDKNLINQEQFESFYLDALLISPQNILKRLAGKNLNFNNRILSILSRPYGGMNEILGLLEVQHHLESKIYDIIILDTPPGKHFIDFLQSCQKIQIFFDNSIISLFQYLKGQFDIWPLEGNKKSISKGKKIFEKIIESGIKKLIFYLEKVTGKTFVEEFIDAIEVLYHGKDSFLKSWKLQEQLGRKDYSNWFLITSSEHDKFVQAQDLQKKAKEFIHSDNFIILNKCIGPKWKEWQDQSRDENIPAGLIKFRNYQVHREEKLKSELKSIINPQNIIMMPEILSDRPNEQLSGLLQNWHENCL